MVIGLVVAEPTTGAVKDPVPVAMVIAPTPVVMVVAPTPVAIVDTPTAVEMVVMAAPGSDDDRDGGDAGEDGDDEDTGEAGEEAGGGTLIGAVGIENEDAGTVMVAVVPA